jgi:DNA/RNA-binding domain of Phe-tRNA-synthetase-like protein
MLVRRIMLFRYDPELRARFPNLRVAAIHARELANGPSEPLLLDAYVEEQRAASERLRATPIAEIPSIAAWRRAFSQFGAKPTQHRNAAEALLRRLDKQGGIPSISTLVDIGNLVSIRHGVPVALFDLSRIAGGLTVRFATGDEPFTDLGSSETAHPEPGEVVFVDRDGVVSARRWCWRQSAESATSPATREALVVIEAQHEGGQRDVDDAATELVALLGSFQTASRIAPYEVPA